MFYLLKKELNRDEAFGILRKVRIAMKTAPVDEKVIELALNSNFADLKDAIQYYCALQVKSDYFITRNKRDYPANLMPILTPDEFLAILEF